MKKQLLSTSSSTQSELGHALPTGPLTLESERKGLLGSWADFWFAATDPLGLHLTRFFTGLLLLFWLGSLAGYQAEFFGIQGWFDRQAYREAAKQQDQPIPEGVYWSPFYSMTCKTAINVFYWGSLGVMFLFTLGLATRWTAPLTWVSVCSFLASPGTLYEADYLLVILAFYLMVGYLLLGTWNGRRSLATWLLGPSDSLIWKSGRRFFTGSPAPAPSTAAKLVLRLLQVHFAMIVVVSALHKLQFGDWWGGVALFYPLHPPLETTPEQIRAETGSAVSLFFWLSLAQYLMLGWQLFFPLFAWRRGWRPVLIGGAIIGWVGSLWLYQMPLFGPIYLIACLSFLTAEEWHGLGKGLGFLGRLLVGRRNQSKEEQAMPAGLQPQRI